MLSQRTEEMIFERARTLAIEAVDLYLHEDVYKRQPGLNRATNLKAYLMTEMNHENLLALFFAVFGVTTLRKDAGFFQTIRNAIDIVPGRSSKLASFIASKWINGDIIYSTLGGLPRKVTSTVFSREVLDMATHEGDNYKNIPMQYSGYRQFEKTKGARFILETVLNSPEFQMSKDNIIKAAEKLDAYLQLGAAHFTLDPNLLPCSGAESQQIQRKPS